MSKRCLSTSSVEGALCAWQKIPSSEEGVFRLLAEFYDASCALRAVQRLIHHLQGVGSALHVVSPTSNAEQVPARERLSESLSSSLLTTSRPDQPAKDLNARS
jgi:hypothetical protein